MKISMSQITTMPLPLAEDLPAFSRAGFTATELQIDKVNRFVATSSVEVLVDMLATLRLKPTGAIGLAPSGPALLLARGVLFDEYLVSLRQQLELCRRIGIDQIGIGADPPVFRVTARAILVLSCDVDIAKKLD